MSPREASGRSAWRSSSSGRRRRSSCRSSVRPRWLHAPGGYRCGAHVDVVHLSPRTSLRRVPVIAAADGRGKNRSGVMFPTFQDAALRVTPAVSAYQTPLNTRRHTTGTPPGTVDTVVAARW
jgi:hypothetical protein